MTTTNPVVLPETPSTEAISTEALSADALPAELLEETAPEVITTFANYGLTWAIYAGLVVLMSAIIWFALRKRHFVINWFISSVILAGALTPGHPVENTETYSPLVLNATVALFDDDSAAFMSGLQTIAIVWAIVFIIGLALWFGIRMYFNRKADKSPVESKAMATATLSEPDFSNESSASDDEKTKIEPNV